VQRNIDDRPYYSKPAYNPILSYPALIESPFITSSPHARVYDWLLAVKSHTPSDPVPDMLDFLEAVHEGIDREETIATADILTQMAPY